MQVEQVELDLDADRTATDSEFDSGNSTALKNRIKCEKAREGFDVGG